MYKFLAFIGFFIMLNPVKGQNSFSFNCTKDTSIICTTSCITLKTILPDIHASTSTYVADQLSSHTCFKGYTNPSTPNLSAKLLIDDRYSPVIDITFPFSFFGTTYNQLVASTNGFLSFDISKTLTFSHYGILANGSQLSATQGTPQNLPSALYDKALIMGPYHDLDPNNSLSTQQIKYEVVGTAPYRKWILTYYNEPLYTTACLNLNKNTHQIVLYETLNLVEVFIYDKEICLNWNNGRAMIGMQNFSKTTAIMAPGRKATDAPWGMKGMDESWRFIPASGQSLFKKVELYSMSGNFLSKGDTVSIGNNQLGVSFQNICPPSSGASYIVKSFYKDPSNLSNEIIGMDTINVSRGDPVTANLTDANCSPGSTGTITITSPIGATYEYSIDGINWQSSNVFAKTVGRYIVQARMKGSECISSKAFSIDNTTFDASYSINVTPCPGPITGRVTVYPEHGIAPYMYSLGGSPFQASNVFTNIPQGVYTLIITDASGCSYSTIVVIVATNLASAKVTNTICGETPSGIINVQAPRYGSAPYTYSINNGPFQSSNIFTNLDAGIYTITIQDSSACSFSFEVTVKPDVLITVNPLITMPSCYGNNNGSMIISVSPHPSSYQYALDSNPYKSDSVFTNLSAGNYVLHVKDSIGCIKDTTITVQQPNPVNETFIITPATNCVSVTGDITIKANGGTTPYLYSVDSGSVYQVNNSFTVSAGVYNVTVKDSKGCKTNSLATVDAINNLMKVDVGPDKTICQGTSITLNTITVPAAKFFKWTPAKGLSDTTSSSVIASPIDTTMYILNAGTEVCKGADTVNINVLLKPTPHAGNDTVICNNTSGVLYGSITHASGSVNYFWSPPRDLLTPNALTTIVKPITIRSHTYRLTVNDNYGCNFNAYDDVIVTMNEPVHAFAGDDTAALIGVPQQLFGSGGAKYFWSPGEVLNNPSLQNPIAILNNDTRFNLVVKDTLGCIGTSSVLVKVYQNSNFYIPNAFTPNGDGVNDLFCAVAPGITHTIYFRIYNRLGQLMYESNDIRKGWDGRYATYPQPSAVYVWVIKGIDLSGKTVERKGIVTLIR